MSQTLPKVLLLGDSIRMSYQARVGELLAGRATVVGPSENCQYSLYTVTRLAAWLAELGKPDLVHWNNGLHDCGHNPLRGPEQFAIPDYLHNLRTILDALRATGAAVIWATTTPQHPKHPCVSPKWWWKNQDIDAYNVAAAELMRGEGVPVNDLHAVVKADPDALLADDRLHLSSAGVERCAQAVASAVEKAIQTRPALART